MTASPARRSSRSESHRSFPRWTSSAADSITSASDIATKLPDDVVKATPEFTGRFGHPPVEVLFDRICRENGVDHLLTAPRSPTTTGKIERFHRTLRAEFDTRRTFSSLKTAQQVLDEWVGFYNTARPHQALGMSTPASRFTVTTVAGRQADLATLSPDRTGEDWVARKVGPNGVVCVSWQQVSVGKHYAGQRCDVHVGRDLLQFWVGAELLKTVTRASSGEVRKKNAARV